MATALSADDDPQSIRLIVLRKCRVLKLRVLPGKAESIGLLRTHHFAVIAEPALPGNDLSSHLSKLEPLMQS